MAQIDKNMTVGDILDLDRETAVYFLNMACIASDALPPAAKPWSRPVWCMA